MDASGRLEPELKWLLDLCKSGTGWQIYAREKADRLASEDRQTWGELPMLLSNAVTLSKFGPARPRTNQPRRSDV